LTPTTTTGDKMEGQPPPKKPKNSVPYYHHFAQPSTPLFYPLTPSSPHLYSPVRRDVPWSPDSPPYTPHSHEQEEEQFSEEEDLQIDEAAELVPPTSPQEQTVQEQEKNETEDLFKDALQFIEDDLTSLLFSILDGVIAEEGETTAAQNRQVVAVVEPVQAIEEQSFTFDTLKIPLQLYMTAHNAKSTTKAASVLFFGLFNAQELKSSTLSGKVGRKGRVEGQMLDPVKLLAIERLVSHMKRTNLDQLPTDDTCCSEIPPLTPTEISEIEKAVYTQEKSQKRARHCNTVDNVSKNGLIHWTPTHPPISYKRWAQIHREMAKGNEKEAGKVLFQGIFTREEIVNSRVKPRGAQRSFEGFKIECFYGTFVLLKRKSN